VLDASANHPHVPCYVGQNNNYFDFALSKRRTAYAELDCWGFAATLANEKTPAERTCRRLCAMIKKVLVLAVLLFGSVWLMVACDLAGRAGGGSSQGLSLGHLATTTEVAALL
jgi:hypothetical protein